MQTLFFSLVLPFGVTGAIIAASLAYKALLDKLPLQQRACVQQIMSWAVQIVHSVEQSMPGVDGQQKKAAAVQDLVAIASAVGLKLPAALIETAIEAAVYELNLWQHAAQPAPVVQPVVQPAASDAAAKKEEL